MVRRLEEIFTPAVDATPEQAAKFKRDLKQPQTPTSVLPRMGITYVDKKHPDALFGSCHKTAADQLRYAVDTGQIDPYMDGHYEIRMLGRQNALDKIYHTIIVDTSKEPEEIVIDALAGSAALDPHYDKDGSYKIKISPRASEHEILDLRHSISVPQFMKSYVEPVLGATLGSNPPTPPSSGTPGGQPS